jgi:hypothetical protein
MTVNVTHMNPPPEQTGLRCRIFIAMAAVAAMTLAGAQPTFAHGQHIGAPGYHIGGKIYCSVGTGTPVTVTPPGVGPVTNAVGERVWWTHALLWFNSGTGQWQWLDPAPQPWRQYRSYQANGQNQFWDDPVARGVGRPFYFSVAYWIYWDSGNQVNLLGPSEAWQGVNNTGWAGGPNYWYCHT